MGTTVIVKGIQQAFPYQPTGDQLKLIDELAAFIVNPDRSSLFILKGYAGTGKTTIVSSLVRVLPEIDAKSVLLAPTGRAAKVLATYAGRQAFTIHKKIYNLRADADGMITLSLKTNKHTNTFFIVDEASMIPRHNMEDSRSFISTSLLDDLLAYTYNRQNCRLIFIGDTAQLPPVKSIDSPALSKDFLERKFSLTVREFELKEVVRQSKESGVLFNATRLRNMLAQSQEGFPASRLKGFHDVIRIDGQDAADEVDNAYNKEGKDEALIICRSNKRAGLFNKHIRHRVLYMEDEINAGDLLMVVRNNYFWLPEDSAAGFIANGDIIELKRVRRIESLYGFRFADVSARLIDYPDIPELDLKLLLDALDSDGPGLSKEANSRLFQEIAADYQHIPNKKNRMLEIKNSPHLNALHVKYAYAMTCHKAQGGQWKHVFIEMGYLPENSPDTAYLRWLYTAISRSSSKAFLLNFTDSFFE